MVNRRQIRAARLIVATCAFLGACHWLRRRGLRDFSPRDFVIGVAAGMFFATALFNYVFKMAARKEEAMRWLLQRVAGR